MSKSVKTINVSSIFPFPSFIFLYFHPYFHLSFNVVQFYFCFLYVYELIRQQQSFVLVRQMKLFCELPTYPATHFTNSSLSKTRADLLDIGK
jgi:hypothetical protein